MLEEHDDDFARVETASPLPRVDRTRKAPSAFVPDKSDEATGSGRKPTRNKATPKGSKKKQQKHSKKYNGYTWFFKKELENRGGATSNFADSSAEISALRRATTGDEKRPYIDQTDAFNQANCATAPRTNKGESQVQSGHLVHAADIESIVKPNRPSGRTSLSDRNHRHMLHLTLLTAS